MILFLNWDVNDKGNFFCKLILWSGQCNVSLPDNEIKYCENLKEWNFPIQKKEKSK